MPVFKFKYFKQKVWGRNQFLNQKQHFHTNTSFLLLKCLAINKITIKASLALKKATQNFNYTLRIHNHKDQLQIQEYFYQGQWTKSGYFTTSRKILGHFGY